VLIYRDNETRVSTVSITRRLALDVVCPQCPITSVRMFTCAGRTSVITRHAVPAGSITFASKSLGERQSSSNHFRLRTATLAFPSSPLPNRHSPNAHQAQTTLHPPYSPPPPPSPRSHSPPNSPHSIHPDSQPHSAPSATPECLYPLSAPEAYPLQIEWSSSLLRRMRFVRLRLVWIGGGFSGIGVRIEGLLGKMIDSLRVSRSSS